MRISDWSSDVCSSDLVIIETDILVEGVKFRAIDDRAEPQRRCVAIGLRLAVKPLVIAGNRDQLQPVAEFDAPVENDATSPRRRGADRVLLAFVKHKTTTRLAIARGNQDARCESSADSSEEHTSELQSLMRISVDV